MYRTHPQPSVPFRSLWYLRYTFSLPSADGPSIDRSARAEAACVGGALSTFRTLVAPETTPALLDLDVQYVGAVPTDAFAPLPRRGRSLRTIRLTLSPSHPATSTFDWIESGTNHAGLARRVEVDARSLSPLNVLLGDDSLRATEVATLRMNNLLHSAAPFAADPYETARRRFRPYTPTPRGATAASRSSEWVLYVRWHGAFLRLTAEHAERIAEHEGNIW